MMKIPIGLQLYSVREQLAIDFEKTIKNVAQAGYEVVELAGLHNQKPEQIALLLKNFNLELIAMHCDVISTDGLKRSLDEAEALNCSNLICPYCPPESFETENNIRKLADKLNNANQLIKTQGRNLLYHNHDFEFRMLNGQPAFNLLEKFLEPSIHFELDTYLATVGGANPTNLMKSFPNRIQMLHLKDGSISPSNPNCALGDGNMNYNAILEAIPPSVNYFFVEIENCATDIFGAIRKSARYLANFTN